MNCSLAGLLHRITFAFHTKLLSPRLAKIWTPEVLQQAKPIHLHQRQLQTGGNRLMCWQREPGVQAVSPARSHLSEPE